MLAPLPWRVGARHTGNPGPTPDIYVKTLFCHLKSEVTVLKIAY